MSEKISDFITVTELPDGSFIDLITPSENKKISKADLITAMGATGTLSQLGDPLGTPILNISGTDNQIRNLEAGAGIGVSVSPTLGAEIKHAFVQNGIGTAITTGLTNPSPVFSSFIPGSGMQITKVNDVITFTATGTPLPATKAVVVNVESDMPAAIGGVITFVAGTVYIISNDVTTANEMVLSAGTSVVSFGKEGPMLTYSGTGTMFTSVDVSCVINNLHYDCPLAKAHDHSDTTGNNQIVNISNSRLMSCVDYGEFDTMGFAVIFNSDCFDNTSKGPIFTGTGWKLISINRFAITTLSGSYVGVDLNSSVSDVVELDDLIVSGPAGSVGVTGLANSGNITVGNLATIINCNFPGDITPITNIDPVSDIRWQSFSNDGIGNSRDDSLISIQGNASETVIAVSGTPVKMVGTWIDEGSSRFTVTLIGGRMTYIGEREARLPISVTTTIVGASGGDKQVSAYIAINGTVVTATKISTTASSSQAGTATLIWQHVFQQNDFVEVFLANDSDTVNLIGQSSVARID